MNKKLYIYKRMKPLDNKIKQFKYQNKIIIKKIMMIQILNNL